MLRFQGQTGEFQKATHQPSNITTQMGPDESLLTVGHVEEGTRSSRPEKAALLYCGMEVGLQDFRDEKIERAREVSCVDGWPQCWRRRFDGWAAESDSWSWCVR